jgi:hypothetical protein
MKFRWLVLACGLCWSDVSFAQQSSSLNDIVGNWTHYTGSESLEFRADGDVFVSTMGKAGFREVRDRGANLMISGLRGECTYRAALSGYYQPVPGAAGHFTQLTLGLISKNGECPRDGAYTYTEVRHERPIPTPQPVRCFTTPRNFCLLPPADIPSGTPCNCPTMDGRGQIAGSVIR